MRQGKIRHGSTRQHLPRESVRLTREVQSIQQRAARHDARIVRIGPLILFATATGDAWILDPADQLATRLAQDGDPLSISIEETESHYAIGWQGRYRIEGETFVYEDQKSHRLIAIRGYPSQLLQRAIGHVDRQ